MPRHTDRAWEDAHEAQVADLDDWGKGGPEDLDRGLAVVLTDPFALVRACQVCTVVRPAQAVSTLAAEVAAP